LAAAIGKDPENVRFIELVVRTEYLQGQVAAMLKDQAATEHFAAALKSCKRLVAIDPINLPYQALLVRCLARSGKADDAVKKADALRPRVAKDPELLVQLAGSFAMCGETAADDAAKKTAIAKAQDILHGLIAAGYKDHKNLITNPDLASLAQFVDQAILKEKGPAH
jgi:predicted Zn-dependent protease